MLNIDKKIRNTGDLYAHEALKALTGKIIIGGIEPPALTRMSVLQTKQYAKDILEKCKNFNNFILSTGDATAYGTPIENLMAITQVVKNFSNAGK